MLWFLLLLGGFRDESWWKKFDRDAFRNSIQSKKLKCYIINKKYKKKKFEYENDNQILVDTLPTGLGETQTSFDIIVEGDFVVDVRCILKTNIVETEGFDYGYCRNPLGFEIDFETIAAPASFNADFGTIGSPLIPTISSVVS